MAVQFRLIPNVLQCIANYWGKKPPTRIKQPTGARDAFTLLRVCFQGLAASSRCWPWDTWIAPGTTGPPRPAESGFSKAQHSAGNSAQSFFPPPEDPIPFSRLIHPRELCFPDSAPFFCPRCGASAELLFTYVNTRP